ncbi:hypothetical protein NDU88_008053 [Pleurodeles waltl]|uniref:Uncharacterized protein n=1 Tax=Pleurodeles waltl TaxID=8319 RepID=A0AAV7QTK2_PLEWA|nr:hypothetical protein NDU88_008053 [Pleurodeles waltl]
MFSKIPGRTPFILHPIRTTQDTVSRQRPYRIPEAKRQILEQEVEAMLKAGGVRTATDTPDVLALTDPATPNPEGEGLLTNLLRHPGSEVQSQRLSALPWINLEAATERRRRIKGILTESPETPRRGRRARAHRRGAEEASLPKEELEHVTGIRRAAPAAQDAPNRNSSHA